MFIIIGALPFDYYIGKKWFSCTGIWGLGRIMLFGINISVYNASSPDELALVYFAKHMGMSYEGKDENNIMTLKFFNEDLRFELIEEIEFNSDRKKYTLEKLLGIKSYLISKYFFFI